ncbi:MAG: hypothetical protein FWD05_10855 [Oscillospiraceae bacterium]|nr:hypothetical protein [Oscillospiraceae bacterium]
MAKSSTRAVKKYQDKMGIIARSYKLKVSDADAFRDACIANGESQSSVLTRLMAAYVENKECLKIPIIDNRVYPTSSDIPEQKEKPILSSEQKREFAKELLLKHHELSNPEIAKMSNGAFAKDTVRRVRNMLIATGEIPN